MLYEEQRIFDIGKGDKNPSPIEPIYLREGENDGTKIIGTIYDDAKPLDVKGYSVVFKLTNPAKMYVDVPGTIENAEDGTVSVIVNHDMTDYRGTIQTAYFELSKGEEIVTTNDVAIKVLASNDLSSEQRIKYQTTIDKLVQRLEALTKEFKDVSNIVITYKAGTSGTSAPSGTYTSAIPSVGQGEYLWAKIQVNYSNNTNQIFYMCARQGKDNTTWGVATSTTDGLMSAADKRKLDSINDYTTGINLLRGTRDFVAGTILSSKVSYACIDGFRGYVSSVNSLQRDENGCNIINGLTRSGNQHIYCSSYEGKLEPGSTLTFFFNYRLNQPITTTQSIAALFVNEGETSKVTAVKNIPANTEVGKWHQGILYITIPEGYNPETYEVLSRITFPVNVDMSFTQVGMYLGTIEHPIWSDNPSDIVTLTKLYENTMYTLEGLFTPDNNFTINNQVMRVNGRLAQIYIYATAKDTLKPNTGYTVGTLDSSIRPALYTGITGRSSNVCVTGIITNDSGQFRISVSDDIAASQQLSMCATYILGNVNSFTSTIPNFEGTLVWQVPSLDSLNPDVSTLPSPPDTPIAY